MVYFDTNAAKYSTRKDVKWYMQNSSSATMKKSTKKQHTKRFFSDKTGVKYEKLEKDCGSSALPHVDTDTCTRTIFSAQTVQAAASKTTVKTVSKEKMVNIITM